MVPSDGSRRKDSKHVKRNTLVNATRVLLVVACVTVCFKNISIVHRMKLDRMEEHRASGLSQKLILSHPSPNRRLSANEFGLSNQHDTTVNTKDTVMPLRTKQTRATARQQDDLVVDHEEAMSANGIVNINGDASTETDTDANISASPTSDLEVTQEQQAEQPWRNDNNIVHVIYTRFMQHQPSLLALGHARLKLFETFCFPTIQKQSNQQFLWFIRIDPELHPTLLRALLDFIAQHDQHKNVVVIGSNQIRKGSVDGGFRAADAISDITSQSLRYGSLELVRNYHAAARNRTVMEVNLDADDGLAPTYIERTEQNTVQVLSSQPDNGNSAWFQWCIEDHIEWQYYAQWNLTTDRGSLRPGASHLCITPGMTWVTQPDAQPDFVASHHLIKMKTQECQGSSYQNCWMHVPTQQPKVDYDQAIDQNAEFLAIRARTPTSTGMNRVVMQDEGGGTSNMTQVDLFDIEMDQHLWRDELPTLLLPNDVRSARRYLKEHLDAIVEENLRGQCTDDHSCSDGIKNKLLRHLGMATIPPVKPRRRRRRQRNMNSVQQ